MNLGLLPICPQAGIPLPQEYPRIRAFGTSVTGNPAHVPSNFPSAANSAPHILVPLLVGKKRKKMVLVSCNLDTLMKNLKRSELWSSKHDVRV